MKNNEKRKLRYDISIYLVVVLIFMSIPMTQALVSMDRTIENNALTAGNGTNVTVVIQTNNTQGSLTLKESIPSGWILTKISDDADQFSTNKKEWVWSNIVNNTTETVEYKITVPSGTAPGIYSINGSVTTNGSTTNVTGDSAITVTSGNVSDTIPPTTNISGVTEGVAYNGSVTITLTATDNPGGSGINGTSYRIDNGPIVKYNKTFVVSKEGPSTIEYWSTDNAKNTEQTKVVHFAINRTVNILPVPGIFGLVVDPLSETVNIGTIAVYNLTISNADNKTDTYNLVADKLNNATVSLDKKSVSVRPGNSSVIRLTVSGSTTGTYTVNVTATSKANANNIVKVKTVTSVIIPVLTIDNFISVPNTTISNTTPAKISANVKKGIYDILSVEFGLVDVNNLIGEGSNTIIGFDRNLSGVQGSYNVQQPWTGTYATIGNFAVSDFVTIYTVSDEPGYALVSGTFRKNNASNDTSALLWFNQTTGNLSNITTPVGNGRTPLSIIAGNSTFRVDIFEFVNGSITTGSGTIFTLYNMTGNSSVNNPRVIPKTVPNGKYRVYAMVNDTNGSIVQWIDIDTNPASSPSNDESSGGSSSSGGSGGGTYPKITPKANASTNVTTNATEYVTVVSTATETETVRPIITTGEPTDVVPIDTIQEPPISKKSSPGFETIVAIGIIGVIYIMRRMK